MRAEFGVYSGLVDRRPRSPLGHPDQLRGPARLAIGDLAAEARRRFAEAGEPDADRAGCALHVQLDKWNVLPETGLLVTLLCTVIKNGLHSLPATGERNTTWK